MAEVLAVCAVHALLPDRGVGVTAIDKRPLTKAVRVRPLGLHGDVQADRRHHGGEDQAVYAYAQEDADRWSDELGRDVVPGLFGENLRTAGVDVTGAVIGERWRVGERLLLEVTSPRRPCGTFERRMGVTGWVARFERRGAPGAYLRVVRAGDVRAGDPIEVVDRPGHGVTIGRWFRPGAADARTLLDAADSGAVRLQPEVREHAEKALAAGSGSGRTDSPGVR
ncbi:MOSC domain-containing protein [Amnibacterium endophyticum]|uniref:MOSC domain-containing protein n=1 Tax=Amnibacterium endophyticum TaxID=2109337 RepID=A0ABW4LGW9_9MICO